MKYFSVIRRGAGDALRPWFGLTPGEQRVVLVVLGLFLLGLAARCWRARPARRGADTDREVVVARP